MTSSQDLAQVHLRITGRVQGVGFRESMRAVALALQVNGWVRNRLDGSVEAVLQGSQEDVERLLEWSHNGPPGAAVKFVQTELMEPGRVFTQFAHRPTL